MVDEKDLIEEIHELPIQVEVSKVVGHARPFVDIADVLECVERQPKIGEWILCSERLPEEVGNYIIHTITASGEDHVFVWYYKRGVPVGEFPTYIDDKQGYWANAYTGNPISEFLTKRMIAWQSLPEPYREEE